MVKTSPYFGPGNVADVTIRRPVTWCKQTEDKIVNGIKIGKDRQLYEPNINPSAYLISSVGIGSTVIYVDNLRPFFDPQNESIINTDFQKSITLISQDSIVSSAATAVVSVAGTISSIVLSENGVGYSTTPTVSIASTIGIANTTSRAEAAATISSGTITGIEITSPGFGYTSSNPPLVLISPPTATKETVEVSSFSGDSGIIVGFGTTSVGSNTELMFDFHIPQNSYLRNNNLVGSAITMSEISAGDYFVVYDSNISIGRSFDTLDTSGSTVGIATSFADAVYYVSSVEDVQRSVSGIGVTYLKRVFARITGISSYSFDSTAFTFDSTVIKFDTSYSIYAGGISTSTYFGNYSWGKINLTVRNEEYQFNSYRNNGYTGITSSTLVSRTNKLKYTNYSD